MDKIFVGQSYWDDSYENLDIDIDISNDAVADFIRDSLKKYGSEGGNVLEVGCYPGRYLRVFGEFGYQLNGIDLTPKVETELPSFLSNKGYNLGSFRQVDFFNNSLKQQYDIVCSFGFLEHFENWEEVIMRHYQLVRSGGLLIITVPNFRGIVQFILHRNFDNINLSRHNTKAMKIKSWIKVFEKQKDFEILEAGYFGNFDFWTDHEKLSKTKKKLLSYILSWKDRIKNKKVPNSQHYSPYMGLVIRKK